MIDAATERLALGAAAASRWTAEPRRTRLVFGCAVGFA
jgi:hypothetical protein